MPDQKDVVSKVSGLFKKALGVRGKVAGARDQIAAAKEAVGAVHTGKAAPPVGLPGADKQIKAATDKLAPPADDAAAGALKGFKVPEKLPAADANVAKAEKIIEGLNKKQAAKGAMPPSPDAVAFTSLQGKLGGAKGQAAAVAAPAKAAAQALPAAKIPVDQAEKAIAALLKGAPPSAGQLKKVLPKIKDTIDKGKKLLPDPKPLKDLAAKVPDVSKVSGDAKTAADALAKMPGPTAGGLNASGTMAQAQSAIASAQGKLPSGAKSLNDGAGKMPDVSAPVDAASGVMESIQSPPPANDPEREAVDALQQDIAGTQSDASSAASAAGKAKDALADTQKKIVDAQTSTLSDPGSLDLQALQTSVDAAQKKAAELTPAMSDASVSEKLAAGLAAAQGKIDELKKLLGGSGEAGAKPPAASAPADPVQLQTNVDTLTKQLDAMQKAVDVHTQGKAPADHIAAAQRKVDELTGKLKDAKKKVEEAKAKQVDDGSKPPAEPSSQPSEDEKKAAAEAAALQQQLLTAQKELEALKKSGASKDQIAAAEKKVADLQAQVKPLTTREALLRDGLVQKIDQLVAGAREQLHTGVATAIVAATTIEAVSNPLNKASDQAAGLKPDSTKADLDKLLGQLQQLQQQAQKVSEGLQASTKDVAAAQQQVDSGTKSKDPMEVKTSVDGAAGGTSKVAAAIADAAKAIGDIQKQVADAEGTVGSLKQASGPAAEALKKQGIVEKAEKLIADLKKLLSDAKKTADSAKDKTATLNEAVAKVKAKTDEWQRDAESLGFFDAAKAKLSDLQAKLPDAGKALNGAGKSAADVQKSLAEAQKVLADIQGGTLPSNPQQALDQVKSLLDQSASGMAALTLPDPAALTSQIQDAQKAIGEVAADKLSPDGKDKVSRFSKLLDAGAKQIGDLASGAANATGLIKPLQDQLAQAQAAFTTITTEGGAALKAAADAVSKAQDAAQQVSKGLPDVSGLLAAAANGFPRGASRLTQVQDLYDAVARGSLTSAEIPGALAELSSLVSGASQQIGASQMPGVADKLSAMKDQLTQAADAVKSLSAGDFPAGAPQVIGQLKDALSQAQGSIAGFAESGGGASSALAGLLAPVQQMQSLVDGIAGAGLTAAAIKSQLSGAAGIQGALAQAQQISSTVGGLISQAQAGAGAVQDGLQRAGQLATQAAQTIADIQSGGIAPLDALKQLANDPAVQGLLTQAAQQFPQVASLAAQAFDLATQAQGGLAQAQSIAASVQSGDLAGAAQQLAALPAVQSLLADAAQQFPEAAALVSQAAAAVPAIQQNLEQASQIVSAFQSGDSSAALQQLAALPIVQDLLGAAARQFPEAAALVTQAQAALAAGQQGLAQANDMLTAFQQGNYSDVAAQMSSLPVVQNLLAQAQQEFPAAAALLDAAADNLPAAEAALAQAQDVLAAFQQGTLTPEMVSQLPIAQSLLATAEQQLTEFLEQNAPEVLEAAAVVEAAAAAAIVATAAVAGAVEVGESTDADVPIDNEGAGAADLLLDITTPLGDGKLEVVTIEGEEELSGLFFYKVVCTSEESDLDFTQIIGQSVTVTVDMGEDGGKRYINGICSRFLQGPQDAGENSTYIIEMRPWFWKLTLAQDCQIFQSKTVPDLITGVFDALGFTDYQNSTTATYAARDYCVQYRETTFNFISRLMEDEGIFYFFKHEDGKHTLVMGDDSDVHQAVPGSATVEYDPSDNADPGTIVYLTMEQAVTTTQFVMDDFNFETSDTDLKVTVDGAGMKVYEYPGGYMTTDAGSARASNHLGAHEMPAKILRGKSRIRTLSTGYKFSLTEHERDDFNADYVVSRVKMKCDQQKYSDEFEAFPAATVFKPALVSKKPTIAGAQTAVVVGKSGEEIWTDQYGRIKVQFHWDQVGVKDENSSCWIRVSQGWAGKSWGMIFLPRMGQEVIVSFLDGDPDRPIVTGCVYNAQNTVPYTLPDDQTKSTIKSLSSKTGTLGNEIRFQDLKDSEELYMYATKDMNVRVVNNMVSGVNNSYQLYVQSGDPTVDANNKYVLVVDGGNASTTIKGDANEETHTNEGKFTQTVAKEFSLTVNGDTLTITATGDLTIKGKSVTIESTSNDVIIKSAANLTAQAAQALTNKSGTDLLNQAGTSLTNKSGTDLTNQAGTSLSNKASVSMTNDGGVSLTNKASASQEVNGGGMLTLKGGMVQIN